MKDDMKELLQSALRGKSGAVELMGARDEEFSVSAFRGTIDSYNKSGSGGCGARALSGRRLGRAYSERLDPASVAAALSMAERNASFMDDDEGNALYDGTGEKLHHEGAGCVRLSDAEAKRFVLELEEACKAADPRVVNVPMNQYAHVSGSRGIANAAGMYRGGSDSLVYAGSYLMASQGDETETGFHVICTRDSKALDIGLIARTAASRATDKLGGTQPESGARRCVLDGEPAGALIGAFLGNIDAEAMQKGASKLAGRVGERVGCELFTVIDDPAAPGFGKRRFDDEGVDSPALTLFDRGVFAAPLYTVYSAKREGARPNGRGFRPGIQSRATASIINGFIAPGALDLAALFREAGSGVYVTELEGLHAGLDPVSGDFSCGAKGFAIEGGQRGRPLKNFTVSGNFYELIKDIAALANDRRLDSYERFTSPSLLLGSLSISGK